MRPSGSEQRRRARMYRRPRLLVAACERFWGGCSPDPYRPVRIRVGRYSGSVSSMALPPHILLFNSPAAIVFAGLTNGEVLACALLQMAGKPRDRGVKFCTEGEA